MYSNPSRADMIPFPSGPLSAFRLKKFCASLGLQSWINRYRETLSKLLYRPHRNRTVEFSFARNSTMKAVRIHEFGGPEVLKYEEIPDPILRKDQVLVRVRACALNHLDLWVRMGLPGVKQIGRAHV